MTYLFPTTLCSWLRTATSLEKDIIVLEEPGVEVEMARGVCFGMKCHFAVQAPRRVNIMISKELDF